MKPSDIALWSLSLIIPERCPVCRDMIRYDQTICPECQSRITAYSGSFSVPGTDGFTVVCEYNSSISPAIIMMKRGLCSTPVRFFGERLCSMTDRSIDYIQPIPMSPGDERERGCNQAALLGRYIGWKLHIPVISSVKKIRSTLNQKELSAQDRAVNLIGAFSVVKPELAAGKRILLVDDVCTTGSTLRAVADVLRKAGAAEIHCAVCCKTPDVKSNNTDKGSNPDFTGYNSTK